MIVQSEYFRPSRFEDKALEEIQDIFRDMIAKTPGLILVHIGLPIKTIWVCQSSITLSNVLNCVIIYYLGLFMF